jgi:NDP-sugar pyrophosphorylase family protein
MSDLWFMPRMPDAVLLCGGAGLRLRQITGNAPKALASVAGRPFLELLLRQLKRYGFERVILAVGYQQELIRSQFGDEALGLRLTYSSESSPLGTGGALRLAADLIDSEDSVFMNGDSYTDVDLCEFVRRHNEAKAEASLVVVPAEGRTDGGLVLVDTNGNVARFNEKQGSLHERYLNAGVYLMSSHLLKEIPAGLALSLEHDLFPRWLDQGKRIHAFACSKGCVDIGTPDRYHNAQHALANAERSANSGRERQA